MRGLMNRNAHFDQFFYYSEVEAMKLFRLFVFISFFTLLVNYSLVNNQTVSAEQTGSVAGQVYDSLGAVISGATVTVVDVSDNKESRAITNQQGEFVIKDLAPGKYIVRVSAPKFALYENSEIEITGGQKKELKIALSIASVNEEVTVTTDGQLSSDSVASATVLNENDIDNLPDDPEQLKAVLRSMAGFSIDDEEDEDGGITVDGFSGGKLLSKKSIRQIRINRNQFSAEYDRMSSGGIEIFTKPGTDQYHGQGFFNFNDARLNSRSPFALNRAPSQSRTFGGSFSGPIQKGKSSFFLDISNSQNSESRVVNASVLDSSFNIVPFRQDINVPTRSFSVSSRFDFQLNKNNTLSARYGFTSNKSDNQGVSDFSLPSRGFQNATTSQDIRLTETMVVNPKTVNETRFGYTVSHRKTEGDNSIPTINVSGAFMGGGSSIGLSSSDTDRWELQNYTTTILGKNNEHAVKFGVKIRNASIEDRSEANFNGVFTFAGVRDPQTGALLFSSIEQYRQKLLGNPDPRFNPNQFSISNGNPLTDISQYDTAFFIMDDWRVRKDLTIGFGLRYENQSNINDNWDFAPRFGFAYAPGAGGSKPTKTVIRGGIGIFYSRLNENFFLQAKRFNGVQQTQYVVTSNPTILGQPIFTLDGVSNVPTIEQLTGYARTNSFTVRRLADDLQSPTTYQAALSIERKLPMRTSVSLSYVTFRNLFMLGTRNINAPVCPALQECSTDAPRPDATQGNVYQYESIGVLNQQQLTVNFNSNAIRKFSFGGNYRLGFANSNGDGAGSFPAYSYDLNSEFGSSSQDVRHNFVLYGSFRLPFKIQMSPFITASSGRPFNITTGVDTNRDSIFNDRPTFTQLQNICVQRGLSYTFCDVSGVKNPDAAIIPRNYGRSSGFSGVNMSFNRTFGFGGKKDGLYKLNVGMQISNLLNQTNQGTPIGNLSSDRFGQSFSSAGSFGFSGGANRRIEMQARFNF